jgi:hypothetical protein
VLVIAGAFVGGYFYSQSRSSSNARLPVEVTLKNATGSVSLCEESNSGSQVIVVGRATSNVTPTTSVVRGITIYPNLSVSISVDILDSSGAVVGSSKAVGEFDWQVNVPVDPGFTPVKCEVTIS